MMSPSEFNDWAEKMNLTEEAKAEIQRIRQSPPARRVGGGRYNVSGRYSSQKMGVTIQFESHKVELPAIYMMEFNNDVLEYYDQPPKIKVEYFQSKKDKTRKMSYWYTADFFVIEKERAYWIEWKTEEELIKNSQEKPDIFFKKNGRWEFLPGKNYAEQFDLDFLVRSSSEINWILQRNLEFLEDYITREYVPKDPTVSRIKRAILSSPGITLLQLIQIGDGQFTADDIYALIAKNMIYIDLNNDLITEPEKLTVYLNKEQYKSFSIIEESSRKTNKSSKIDLKNGQEILWGDTVWRILHYDNGNKTVFLIKEGEKEHKEIPLEIFESYISDGYIEGIDNATTENNDEVKNLISQASEKDLEVANKRYEIVVKILNGEKVEPKDVTQRTLRNWVKKYKDAEELYGYGFVGLLPKTKSRGNRKAKLPIETKNLMEQIISENYATIKAKSIRAVYREFIVKCEELKIPEASYKAFWKAINSRSKYDMERARKGRRASYEFEEFYYELEFTTPKHGERVFNIAHIDHTLLDVELDVGEEQIRPWLTLMIDAFSRRILAFHLTFDPPSYRSCMMVLRECVKNYNRLPNYIVVDGGKEFNSVYFESLLAFYKVHKKERPAAKARFGTVVERMFGKANDYFFHNLQGNTKITKNVRQVTKSVNPKNHAIWTLETLNEEIERWINETYDNIKNSAFGDKTPKEVFKESIKMSGSRPNTYIPYNDTFILMTLPSPSGKTRKVHIGRGIKLFYSYYWCKEFRDPKIENTKVEVKYDPFNIGVIYAFINNKWVKCLSEEYRYLNGKTEREIKIIAEEIRKKKSLYSRSNSLTAKMIARFIIESEKTEEKLNEEKRKASREALKRNLTIIEDQNDVDEDFNSYPEITVDDDIDYDKLVDYGELSI